jgi:hypothetical protein
MLGHVDLGRGDTLDVTTWAIGPPCLAEVSDGTFLVSGAWSDAARRQLEIAVDEAGGKFTYVKNGGLTTWFAEKLSRDRVDELLAAPHLRACLPAGTSPSVVLQAAKAMVETLSPLSTVAGALSRVPLPGARRIERFHLASASWQQVVTPATPGAYRLTSAFRTLYVYRSETDVERHEAAVGTAQLVKHLDALRMARPLLGYYPKSQRLAVPPVVVKSS